MFIKINQSVIVPQSNTFDQSSVYLYSVNQYRSLRAVQMAILNAYPCAQEQTSVRIHQTTFLKSIQSYKCSLMADSQLVCQSDTRTGVVPSTHVHVNAGQGKYPCGRRLLGHEAVEFFVPSVPFDGIKCFMLQVVIAG
jgi:hypothetical protein